MRSGSNRTRTISSTSFRIIVVRSPPMRAFVRPTKRTRRQPRCRRSLPITRSSCSPSSFVDVAFAVIGDCHEFNSTSTGSVPVRTGLAVRPRHPVTPVCNSTIAGYSYCFRVIISYYHILIMLKDGRSGRLSLPPARMATPVCAFPASRPDARKHEKRIYKSP